MKMMGKLPESWRKNTIGFITHCSLLRGPSQSTRVTMDDIIVCINTYKELLLDIQTPKTEGKDYLYQVIVSPFLFT